MATTLTGRAEDYFANNFFETSHRLHTPIHYHDRAKKNAKPGLANKCSPFKYLDWRQSKEKTKFGKNILNEEKLDSTYW